MEAAGGKVRAGADFDMRERVAHCGALGKGLVASGPVGKAGDILQGASQAGYRLLVWMVRVRRMFPYIHLGPVTLGTFGLLLWLAAVLAAVTLHWTFRRDGVDGDALNVVAMVVIAGVIGAKVWHELQDPAELRAALHQIGLPGWHHAWQVVVGFFEWFKAGFAWFGGMLAGIAMLMAQGAAEKPNGMRGFRAGVRMMDLAAAAAAVGYGVGRLGCLTSGDGDYGRNTTGWWGVWEFAIALVLAWVLWRLGHKARPLGWLTGAYLAMSGTARFVVEFWRINPKLYFNHSLSNAQVAALGSVIAGVVLMLVVRRNPVVGGAAAAVPTATPAVAEPAA
jgi:phosphatidylglycerol:prolipoprotein diacylglycerol transferase